MNYCKMTDVHRRASELKEDLQGEVGYVSSHQRLCWTTLAGVAGLEASPQVLKEEALLSMHIAAAFSHGEAFLELEGLPASLAKGNLRDNVDIMYNFEQAPADRLTRQT